MSRRKAREIVLCLVFEKEYQRDLKCEKLYNDLFENGDMAGIYNSFIDNEEKENKKSIKSINEADEKYIKNTFLGIFENIENIDDIISSSSIGWEYSRISKISMALLRIAVYEILYADDVPTAIAINEAVELAKTYGTDESYQFVNGILGKIYDLINDKNDK